MFQIHALKIYYQRLKGNNNMRAICLFEQSGTFKNEFKKLGIDAYDVDIQNKFTIIV